MAPVGPPAQMVQLLVCVPVEVGPLEGPDHDAVLLHMFAQLRGHCIVHGPGWRIWGKPAAGPGEVCTMVCTCNSPTQVTPLPSPLTPSRPRNNPHHPC